MTAQPVEEPTLLERRYRARHWRWAQGTPWQRRCGRGATGPGVGLLRYPDGSLRGEGTQHCMSVWGCPVCSARILATRAKVVAAMLAAWRKRGGHVAMVTLTIRHSKGQSLDSLWDAVNRCWAGVTASPVWQRQQREYGESFAGRGGKVARRLPILRTTEITVGENGWHPHIHALVFLPETDEARADDLLTELFQGMVGRWTKRAEKVGVTSVARVQEAHLLRGDDYDKQAGDYLAKQMLGGSGTPLSAAQALEMGRPDLKGGRSGSRTPFELLEQLATGVGDSETRRLWDEFVRTSRGKRQMGVTSGFLEFLGLDYDGRVLTEDSEALEASCSEMESAGPDSAHYVNPIGPPEFVGFAGSRAWWKICGQSWEQLAGLLLRNDQKWKPPEGVRVYDPGSTGTATRERVGAVGHDRDGLILRGLIPVEAAAPLAVAPVMPTLTDEEAKAQAQARAEARRAEGGDKVPGCEQVRGYYNRLKAAAAKLAEELGSDDGPEMGRP